MREYVIKSSNGKKVWGVLYYSDKKNQFKVKFRENIDIKKEKPPAYVRAFLEAGMKELNKFFSHMWVTDRIIPPDRQNIDSILKDAGLTSYREIDMLELCMGRSTFDDIFLERVR